MIDIFPTINDILGIKFNRKELYNHPDFNIKQQRKFIPLQGKSLAPLVLGRDFRFRAKRSTSMVHYRGEGMPILNRTFAISQTWRCAQLHEHMLDPRKIGTRQGDVPPDFRPWDCCNIDNKEQEISLQISVMGYAMRTFDYRYIAYVHMLRPHRLPQVTTSCLITR